MSITGGIMAGVGLAGGLGSAAIGANASQNAAATQAAAAQQAAQLQYQESQNSLGFQEGVYNQQQANEQPWLQSGTAALGQLDNLLGIGGNYFTGGNTGAQSTPISNPFGTGGNTALQRPTGGPALPAGAGGTSNLAPGVTAGTGNPLGPGVTARANSLSQPIDTSAAAGAAPFPGSGTPGVVPTGAGAPSTPSPAGAFGSLMQAYPGGPFVAPTASQALASPSEQAQLKLGEQALQQSAAANGSLLTGGTAQALDQFGQNLASTGYQNAYANALNTYGTNYNTFEQNQTNQYNRLASLAGIGQTTAGQLGQFGSNAAAGVSNNLLSTGQAIGQQYNNAAAANASGIVGAANAYGGALSGGASSISNLLLLNQLQGANGGGGGGGSFYPEQLSNLDMGSAPGGGFGSINLGSAYGDY